VIRNDRHVMESDPLRVDPERGIEWTRPGARDRRLLFQSTNRFAIREIANAEVRENGKGLEVARSLQLLF
jgi:hypothetical protein